MKRRPELIGQIFVEMGLIFPDDVARALTFQRERGGYFGDALIALGLLTQDQVKWGLAIQADMPFVNLRPENVDRSVAAMVPAEWARQHLILPVLRYGNTVTALLTSPPSESELEEARHFTRADRVEVAMTTAENIHELIASVHDTGTGSVRLSHWISEALTVGAREIGLSARVDTAHAWYRIGNVVDHYLENGWSADLRRLVVPFPDPPVQGVRQWPAVLSTPNGSWRIECSVVGTGATLEWTARIGSSIPTSPFRLRPDADIQARFSRGAARAPASVQVFSSDEKASELLDVLLPGLPALLGGPDVRAIHIADRPVAVLPEVLLLTARGPIAELISSLQPFSLDALTVDVESLSAMDLAAAQNIAPLVFFHTRNESKNEIRPDLELCLYANEGRVSWMQYERANAAD